MPPCSVSGCTSGRKGSEKVQTFRYPSDDVMKKKWLKLIGRTTVGKDAVVCKKHFPLGYLKQKPKHPFASLSPNAVPTLFDFGPTPKSFKRKRRSETEVDTNLKTRPNISKKPRKNDFNEHSYCYKFPKLPNENSEDTLDEGN